MSLNPDEIAMSALTPTPPFEVAKVVDTRDFIEIDDRFVPVPGSGDARECDRCSSTHEIHAFVVDANGNSWCVGTGCMNVETNEARSHARRATSAAKKAARRDAAANLVAWFESLEARVAALTFPADRVEYTIEEVENGRGWHRWEVDGAWAKLLAYVDVPGEPHTFSGELDARTKAERLTVVEDNWRRERLHELILADLDEAEIERLGGPERAPRMITGKVRREEDWLRRNPA